MSRHYLTRQVFVDDEPFIKRVDTANADVVRMPNKTDGQILSIVPQIGDMVYNTTTNKLQYRDNISWRNIAAEGYVEANLRNWVTENFVGNAVGSALQFLTSTASGGTVVQDLFEEQPNFNSTLPLGRLGITRLNITTTASSRAGFYNSSGIRLYDSVNFGYYVEVAFVNGLINVATDNVFQAVGFLQTFAAITANGIFFRCPRVGESSFMKFIVRIGGSDLLVLDTTVPFDSTNSRYVRLGIEKRNTSLYIYCSDGTTTYENTFPNFFVTYPALATLNMSFGALLARSGTQPTPLVRSIKVDRVECILKSHFI